MAHKYFVRSPYTGTRYEVNCDAALTGHLFASAGVKFDEHGTHLYSYLKHVATISPDGWLHVYGLYSATTRRHIGYFLKEYACGTYYSVARTCYDTNKEYNYRTGKYRSLFTAPEEP